jgi:hypothetical protein
MIRTLFIAAALAFVATLPAAPAQAQVIRTFVSAGGSDSNNCANVATPCRHFQTAVNATAAGGEVVALDPANYGSITISQAITIEGQGWSYIAPPNSGNGITVNAVSGNVTIRGVLLNGEGATGGTNGIVFNSGGSLTVTDCVAENFNRDLKSSSGTGYGILIQPPSGVRFVIKNTTVSSNRAYGIAFLPVNNTDTVDGVIDHVVSANNGGGINIDNGEGGPTMVAISNSIFSNNSNEGILVDNDFPLTVSIDNAVVSGNTNGIVAFATTTVLLGRSVITGNSGIGIINNTSPNTFYSYKDSRINLNGTDANAGLNSFPLN